MCFFVCVLSALSEDSFDLQPDVCGERERWPSEGEEAAV